MERFPQVVTSFSTNSEPCHPSKMELFAKIVKNQKPFTIFLQKPLSWMFGKVLNMLPTGFQS